jgi:hypothetical protein
MSWAAGGDVAVVVTGEFMVFFLSFAAAVDGCRPNQRTRQEEAD